MDRYDPSNPSIKWQRQENRNIGFDASLFNNRINLVVNYYNNDTRNLLDDKKIAASTGRISVTANVASVNNKGWEISLRTLKSLQVPILRLNLCIVCIFKASR